MPGPITGAFLYLNGMQKILIASWPLDQSSLFGPYSDDPELVSAITVYYHKELEPCGIELYHQKGNKIATESGFFGAFYERDLEKCE